jgi:hypothetical protein
VDLRVLPRGVLDGTAQFSALSKYLVPNGRQVLWKGVKLGGFATVAPQIPHPPGSKQEKLSTQHTHTPPL